MSDLPANGAGNPQFRQFPYSETQTAGTTLVVYNVGEPSPRECVHVAAHAEVTNTVTGQEETAWGDAELISGGSWAMMFQVCNYRMVKS